MTPQEHARDLLLRLSAIRPESPDDISNLLVQSFEEAICHERALNAELVAALQAMYEEFQHSNDFRPDSMIARKARATLIKAKEALQ